MNNRSWRYCYKKHCELPRINNIGNFNKRYSNNFEKFNLVANLFDQCYFLRIHLKVFAKPIPILASTLMFGAFRRSHQIVEPGMGSDSSHNITGAPTIHLVSYGYYSGVLIYENILETNVIDSKKVSWVN